MIDHIELVETQFAFRHNGETLFTGTPDRVLVFDDLRKVAVLDRKFGRLEVPDVSMNMQLRAYLTMVAEEFEADKYYAAIVQPRISNRPFIVAYSAQDIEASRREIVSLFHASHAPNAPRRASEDACRYCRAVAVCEEHKAWIMAIEKVAHLPAASWSPEQWNMFLERKSALSKFIEERYEEAKAIKAVNPDAIPGWELKDGVERRVISDVVGAWSKLSEMLSARGFSDCCEVSVGAIEKAIWESRRDTKQKLSQKEVKTIVNVVLDGLIERKRNQPSLVRSE